LPAGRSELVELATRLIVEEALEGEVRDALDRGYYSTAATKSAGLRRGKAIGMVTEPVV
jgi:putative transposase